MPAPLHAWNLSPAEAVALQRDLAGRVDVSRPLPAVETVAGCDVSFDRGSPLMAAAVVVIRLDTHEEVERSTATVETKFPYVPGLLSFRELPPLLAAWARLRSTPSCAMLDGQGLAHPRLFGVACHLGLWLGLPAVGCAKSRLAGDYAEPGPDPGDESPLTLRGRAVGAVLRSRRGAGPLFVSPGHLCDVPSAVALVRRCLGGRKAPLPTLLAHEAANAARRAARG